MVSKDQSIIMQVAAKIAADLTPKSDDVNSNIAMFADAYDAVCEIMLNSQGVNVAPQPITQSTTSATPAQTDEQILMQAFPQATQSSIGFTVTIKGKQHGPLPEWLHEACLAKGVTEVWDNRDGLQANPKRPWFKSTSGSDAFWPPKNK